MEITNEEHEILQEAIAAWLKANLESSSNEEYAKRIRLSRKLDAYQEGVGQ